MDARSLFDDRRGFREGRWSLPCGEGPEEEKKERTELLEEALAFLEEAQELAALGSFSYDIAGDVLLYSESLKALFGFGSSGRLSFADYLERIHPDDRDRVAAVRQAAWAAGEDYRFEARYLCLDGEIRHFQLRAQVTLDREERPKKVLGTFLDVTEAVRLRRRLEASEAHYRAIFENGRAVMLVIDPSDGSIVDANEAAVRFYGYSRPVLTKMNIKAINQLSAVEIAEEMEKARSLRDNFFQFPHRLASGEVRTVHVYSGPIALEGHPLLYSLVFDVTEKLRAEEALIEKSRELARSLENLEEAWQQTLKVMAYMAELRDPHTMGHQRRVAALASEIARELMWDEESVEELYLAALVHDIGKIEVPSDYLSRPGPLKPHEFRFIKEHPRAGYELLKGISLPWPLAEIVYEHHERMDGSGYPQGLRGDAIHPAARIMAVADIVEAMTAHRPYRPALDIEAALAEIESQRGRTLEAIAVDTCLRLFRERDYRFPDVAER